MNIFRRIASAALALYLMSPTRLWAEKPRISILIVDGQNNHDWVSTTAELKKILNDAESFSVYTNTSPGAGGIENFEPNFSSFNVVVLNYNGDLWPQKTRDAFERYMRTGGGLVVVHAADNAFPEWAEYNTMIGLGGWGGRDEKSGPYVRICGEKTVRDFTPGPGGNHGKFHAFSVKMRRRHPILKGLQNTWLHGPDELYDHLRGPAKNLTVLATAFSDPKTGGSGEHEPVLFMVQYGKGRVFHTTLGHNAEAMRSAGFITTLQRGAEWAATGKVRQKSPKASQK